MSAGRLKPWSALAGRLGVALLLGLALWNPGWRSSLSPVDAVIVLDESRSMDAGRPHSAWWSAAASLSALPPGSRYSLVRFGAEPVLEIARRPVMELAGQPPLPRTAALDGSGTDVEAALRLAAQQPGGEIPGLMLLVTDGGETSGDAGALLADFQTMAMGAPFLLLDTFAASGPDAAIEVLDVPSEVPFGSEAAVVLGLGSTRDGPAAIELRLNSERVAKTGVDLASGERSFVGVPLAFDSPGFHELEASISLAGDINPANDRRRAIVNVEGPTAIFYVSGKTGTAVSESLLAGGWNLSIIRPEHFPQVLPLLPSPATVVLDDVAIGDIPEPAWVALTDSVRSRGSGLIVLGGQRSFGAGDYLNSTLETALPVTAQAGAPMSRAAVLFVVDKSGSMGRGPGGATSFGLARTAVLAATELLGERDHSGIIAFDINPETWLPLADRDDPTASATDAWRGVPSGGTRIGPALLEATGQLGNAEADQRLLLLVTDGFAVEDDYSEVLGQIDEYGIDLIALAIGNDPAIEVLEELTSRNDGLLLRVSDVATLPRLASEAVGSRRLTWDSGVARPVQDLALPFLSDLDDDWPGLSGYMVTKERSRARVYLRSERGDPLLAEHHFGLGRVVVLPGGLGAYTPAWPEWPAWAPFIGGLVEWAGGRFGDDRLYLRIKQERGRPQLEIDALSPAGGWETRDAAQVRLSDPFGRVTVLNAEAWAPGKYRVELPLPHSGRYRAIVQVGSVSKPHDFFHQAQLEQDAAIRADQILDDWLSNGLLQPWAESDSIRAAATVTVLPTRPFFIAAAALLYLGILLWKYAYVFRNWRMKSPGQRK